MRHFVTNDALIAQEVYPNLSIRIHLCLPWRVTMRLWRPSDLGGDRLRVEILDSGKPSRGLQTASTRADTLGHCVDCASKANYQPSCSLPRCTPCICPFLLVFCRTLPLSRDCHTVVTLCSFMPSMRLTIVHFVFLPLRTQQEDPRESFEYSGSLHLWPTFRFEVPSPFYHFVVYPSLGCKIVILDIFTATCLASCSASIVHCLEVLPSLPVLHPLLPPLVPPPARMAASRQQ